MKRNAIRFAVMCLCVSSLALVVAAVKADDKPFEITGKWNGTIHMVSKEETQTWDIKHEGEMLTGTVKTSTGELPFTGRLKERDVRGLLKEGEQNHQVHLTVDGEDMDGTIRMGKNEYLIMLRRAK
jgi:hypothetical protein